MIRRPITQYASKHVNINFACFRYVFSDILSFWNQFLWRVTHSVNILEVCLCINNQAGYTQLNVYSCVRQNVVTLLPHRLLDSYNIVGNIWHDERRTFNRFHCWTNNVIIPTARAQLNQRHTISSPWHVPKALRLSMLWIILECYSEHREGMEHVAKAWRLAEGPLNPPCLNVHW